MEDAKPLIQLSLIEQRIIGSLLEKSKTTPDYYPMSLNSLVAACNQKTSRNPVVNFDEETVTLTLNALKIKGLASTVTGGSSRTVKWKHNLAIVYPLIPSELAVICLLFLRGPSTPGEINTNSSRLYEFETIEEVQNTLAKLASDQPAFVQQLPRKSGQKEARYVHLFGDVLETEAEPETEVAVNNSANLEDRVARLEQEVADLKEMINLLIS
jgi:uncharacterized protein YceH (UPF0502 family)